MVKRTKEEIIDRLVQGNTEKLLFIYEQGLEVEWWAWIHKKRKNRM